MGHLARLAAFATRGTETTIAATLSLTGGAISNALGFVAARTGTRSVRGRPRTKNAPVINVAHSATLVRGRAPVKRQIVKK